jgi:hypothetical protein
MSIQLRSGATTDLLTIDATSKAARVTLYNAAGAVISTQSTTRLTNRTSPLVFRHVIVDLAGQSGGAYNFVALNNPAASGKRIALLSVEFQVYSVAAAATKNSLTLVHCTAVATGGASDTANIARLLSTQNAPVATVLITNPTITAGKQIKAFGAGGVVTAAGIYGAPDISYRPVQEDYQFLALEGEGFAIRQTVAGDTDQTYCINMEWMEFTP